MGGAQVGCVVGEGVHDVSKGDKSCSPAFKSSLEKLFEDLLMEFAVKGADCVEFLPRKAKVGIANTADTTLWLWNQVQINMDRLNNFAQKAFRLHFDL